MEKSSLTPRVAICGHTYTGYVFIKKVRPYCPDCIPSVRRRIDEEAAQRAIDAADLSRRTSFYISRANRLAIYERDGWVCQLCLDPVDANLTAPDPWSPSLDHIACQSWTVEPDHSPSNLRLTHRWCNVMRGNESHWTAADFLPTSSMT